MEETFLPGGGFEQSAPERGGGAAEKFSYIVERRAKRENLLAPWWQTKCDGPSNHRKLDKQNLFLGLNNDFSYKVLTWNIFFPRIQAKQKILSLLRYWSLRPFQRRSNYYRSIESLDSGKYDTMSHLVLFNRLSRVSSRLEYSMAVMIRFCKTSLWLNFKERWQRRFPSANWGLLWALRSILHVLWIKRDLIPRSQFSSSAGAQNSNSKLGLDYAKLYQMQKSLTVAWIISF